MSACKTTNEVKSLKKMLSKEEFLIHIKTSLKLILEKYVKFCLPRCTVYLLPSQNIPKRINIAFVTCKNIFFFLLFQCLPFVLSKKSHAMVLNTFKLNIQCTRSTGIHSKRKQFDNLDRDIYIICLLHNNL